MLWSIQEDRVVHNLLEHQFADAKFSSVFSTETSVTLCIDPTPKHYLYSEFLVIQVLNISW
jgi:hypothetical protein